MIKLIAYLIISLLIWGCATPYSENTWWSGVGFDETQLDTNSWRVSFKGGEFDSKERIYDLCLLRCSELAVRNGYTHFSIIDKENTTKTSSYTTPTYTTPTYTNQIGTGLGSFQTTTGGQTYGGQTYYSTSLSTSIEIECHKSEPLTKHSYNAEFMIKSISAKYKIPTE